MTVNDPELNQLDAKLIAAASLALNRYVKKFINLKANVNATTLQGLTPLGMALGNMQIITIVELLKHGAIATHPVYPSQLTLPLEFALQRKRYDIAKVLLEYDQTLVDCSYNTANKALDGGDKTPLMLLAQSGDTEGIAFLLAYQPNPYLVCSEGKCAQEYAKQNHHQACAKLIYDYMINYEFNNSQFTVSRVFKLI